MLAVASNKNWKFHNLIIPGQVFVDTVINSESSTLGIDPTLAWAIGPAILQDPNSGMLSTAWRGRILGESTFQISRAAGGNEEWEDWISMVDFGEPVLSLSITFDQNANIFAAFQTAAGRVKIYWYDPTIPAMSIMDVAAGRTPVCVLDNFTEAADGAVSDVLLFWIPAGDAGIVYAQQRDRYDTVYATPVTRDLSRGRILLTGHTIDWRIRVAYAWEECASGQPCIRLDYLDTVPYPHIISDSVVSGAQNAGFLIEPALISYSSLESATFGADITSVIIAPLVIFYDSMEMATFGADITSVTIASLIVTYIATPEMATFGADITSVTIVDIVIQATAEPEMASFFADIVSVTIAPP